MKAENKYQENTLWNGELLLIFLPAIIFNRSLEISAFDFYSHSIKLKFSSTLQGSINWNFILFRNISKKRQPELNMWYVKLDNRLVWIKFIL
jgi:hypothetical protein